MSEPKEKRSVNWHRLGQALVALLVVCCLLVNVSPIKARAVEPVTTALVSATVLIGAALIGLGIGVGANATAFQEVVQMVQGSNALKDFVDTDGKCEIIRFPGNYGGDGNGDISPWMVPLIFLEAVRAALFDECEIVDETSMPEGCVSYGGYVFPAFETTYPYAIVGSYNDELILQVSQFCPYAFHYTPSVAGGVGIPYEHWTIASKSSSLSYYQVYKVGDSGWESWYSQRIDSSYATGAWSFDFFIWSNCDIFHKDDGSLVFAGSTIDDLKSVTIGTDYDLTLGNVASPDEDISTGYPSWVTGSQWDVNNSEWWPIGLGQTLDETMGYTQEKVQAGDGTYIVADNPVYDVNLPLGGSVTYERFATAQPLTVSASVTDGGTISYEWFRYQTDPTLGGSESVGAGSSIVPDTSNTGTWTYYCKATNAVGSVVSLPVTSNYCSVTIIDPSAEENPDTDPTEAPDTDATEAPETDPDAGSDPDPENKTDVESEGNQNIDDLLEVIPDHSGEFGDVLKSLADSMTYEGTEAILTIPQVNFPALGNLVPGFVMLEETQVNFADYVEMMPDDILLLVQSLLTVALIMYCFYEFYATIKYALTLKEG